VPAPPAQAGQTAPVLLLTNHRSSNPFGPYLGEILRAEGLNLFSVADIESVDAQTVRQATLTLLAEGPLTPAQAELLQRYVQDGGNLIAMRPDALLAPLLGVERTGAAIAEGYFLVESAHPAGRGIAAQSLQYHGEADAYRLADAEPIAWLYRDAATPTRFPAVALHRAGRGQAVLWAFDPARSIAYTRQGNPERRRHAGDDRGAAYRAMDMFAGWVDLDRVAIPQADELQRLLANVIALLGATGQPLPRFWYLPAGASGLLVVTSDSHGNPAAWIERLLAEVERRGGRASVYYAPPVTSQEPLRRAARAARAWASTLPLVGPGLASPLAPPEPEQVAAWRAKGHGFGIHPFVENGIDAGYSRHRRDFGERGLEPVPPTVRTHRVLWDGWVEAARVQAGHGMRMNLDYYHCSPAFRTATGPRVQWVHGHFTGSALPMKFVDEQGRILDIYQQVTQLVDEYLLKMWLDYGPQLDGEAAVRVSREVLGTSIDNGYGPVVAQFHADGFDPGTTYYQDALAWAAGTLAYAAERGIPIWSAEQWLAFVEARHDAALYDSRWDEAAGRLTFQLEARTPADADLAVMLPRQHGEKWLAEIRVDGRAGQLDERRVGGVTYGWVSVPAGAHHLAASYAPARTSARRADERGRRGD
jgi:hypothetical protein